MREITPQRMFVAFVVIGEAAPGGNDPKSGGNRNGPMPRSARTGVGEFPLSPHVVDSRVRSEKLLAV